MNNKQTLAIIIWGEQEYKDILPLHLEVTDRFSDRYTIHVYYDKKIDVANQQKINHEIAANEQYDVCLYVNSLCDPKALQSLRDFRTIEPSTFYFVVGEYSEETHRTFVCDKIFYCDTVVGNIAVKYKRIQYIETFYKYLKSYRIKTKCHDINSEFFLGKDLKIPISLC